MTKLYKNHNSKRALGEITNGAFKPNKTGIKYLSKIDDNSSLGYKIPLYKKGKIHKIILKGNYQQI